MSVVAEVPGIAGDPRSPVHRLTPRTKVLGFGTVTVVAVSTSPSLWPAWVACLLALAGVAVAARVPAAAIARRSRVVLPFVLVGPIAMWHAGPAAMAAISVKAAIGTLSAVLLGATTPLPQTLAALERLRVPRLFVTIAATTHRYLPVVIGEVQRTRTALLARGWRGRSALGAAPVGRVAGTLFLRAQARGERVHRAMLARGYTGALPAPPAVAATRRDAVFALAVPGAVLAVRALAELS
jgi:cobalt/nickel transport system permease protein